MPTKTREALISLATIVAVAAVNYTIIHNPIVFVMTFILFLHELGHYLAAERHGIKSVLPFFIPLPFFPLGITLTDPSFGKARKDISISGALSAALSLILLIVFNFKYKIFSMFVLFSALLGEIVFNYIGIDGQRYRGWTLNKKEHLNQHIEIDISKEKLWKTILKSPYRLKTSSLS